MCTPQGVDADCPGRAYHSLRTRGLQDKDDEPKAIADRLPLGMIAAGMWSVLGDLKRAIRNDIGA